SGYDLKWLLATIANTEAYQRSLGMGEFASTSDEAPFLAASPTRLRADHVYAALIQVVGEPTGRFAARGPAAGGRYADRSPRRQFVSLFGFDPSVPHDDVTGDVPQALFLMNSPLVASRLRATGDGPLAEIVRNADSHEEVIEEIYLLALSRRPTHDEVR